MSLIFNHMLFPQVKELSKRTCGFSMFKIEDRDSRNKTNGAKSKSLKNLSFGLLVLFCWNLFGYILFVEALSKVQQIAVIKDKFSSVRTFNSRVLTIRGLAAKKLDHVCWYKSCPGSLTS